MKIVYSLPHPSHRLDEKGAGHTVRANAILSALESLGVEIIRDQAAQGGSQAAAKTYRDVAKRFIPRPIAMRMRDSARVVFGKQYGERLTEIVRQHQPDVILQTHIAFSLSGKIASEATGVPLVLDDVAPSWEEKQLYGVGNARAAVETHRETTGHAQLCAAVSRAMRRFLMEDGIPDHKLIALPNGIDDRIFHPHIDGSAVREQYGFDNNTVVIVFVGSFQPYHRVDWLLEAFSRVQTVRRVRLLLVGAGRMQPEAEALTRNLDLTERVIFTGGVDYQRVPEYVAASDIAIMPATNTYGNPMKVYEYMALGKAVIGPDQETIREIGTHEHDILTFEPENIDAMAATLMRVIDDETLRERLGDQAAETIIHDHTWRKRGEALLSAIEARVLSGTSR